MRELILKIKDLSFINVYPSREDIDGLALRDVVKDNDNYQTIREGLLLNIGNESHYVSSELFCNIEFCVDYCFDYFLEEIENFSKLERSRFVLNVGAISCQFLRDRGYYKGDFSREYFGLVDYLFYSSFQRRLEALKFNCNLSGNLYKCNLVVSSNSRIFKHLGNLLVNLDLRSAPSVGRFS